MKGFKLSLFLSIIWWSIVSASFDDDVALETQTPHQVTTFRENDLNTYEDVVNMASDIVDYTQDFFNAEDLKKICYGQVNEFIWKCPTMREKVLKFRTIEIGSSTWYLESINGINIVEMNPDRHQIQFYVKAYKQTISLSRLYPTYPEISGFEILQFITNLAFQCKFFIDVFDLSDISTIYATLYGKSYYEYYFKGVNLSQNFLFKTIVVKKKAFLECFETSISSHLHVETKDVFESLPQLFYKNIQDCENAFVSVEFCPISFNTQRIFYEKSFQYCIDWSPIGGFPGTISHFSRRFTILLEDITHIMKTTIQCQFCKIKLGIR